MAAGPPREHGGPCVGNGVRDPSDKNFDEEFITRYSQDFRGGKEDFQTMVTRDYPPDKVSAITGVPAETLLRLARNSAPPSRPWPFRRHVGPERSLPFYPVGGGESQRTLAEFSSKGLWRQPVPLHGHHLRSSMNARSGAFSLKRNWPGYRSARPLGLGECHLRSAGKLPDLEMLMIGQVDRCTCGRSETVADWPPGFPW